MQQIPAMLVELNISAWTANVLDKTVSEEVTTSKGASTSNAGKFRKNLLADIPQHKRIGDFAAKLRVAHMKRTLPWCDRGPRLLPAASIAKYQEWADFQESEFESLVSDLIDNYTTIVQAQQFRLGSLFDRDLYPNEDEVRRKFKFKVSYMPLPSSGDFRVEVFNDMQKDLAAKYEAEYDERLERAMRDAWDRLHDSLTHLSDRLSPNDAKPGKPKQFHDSLIPNVLDLCESLTALNVAGDPKLEQARQKLESAISGLDAPTLREDEALRETVKSKVDDIISKFSM